jgi:hypothetical protein
MSAHKSAKWSALVRCPVRSLRRARDHQGRMSPPAWAHEGPDVPPAERLEADDTPQDRWSAIDDVWTRLTHQTLVRIEATPDFTKLTIQCEVDPSSGNDIDLDLLALVQDPNTYCWRDGPRSGSFVQWIETERMNLVIWMTPLSLIHAWPGGHDLAWQIHAWLSQIAHKGRQEVAS